MLDAKIRNWVLIPILLVSILVQISRTWVQVLMKTDSATDADKLAHMQLLGRSARLRTNGNLLVTSVFQSRRDYFTKKGGGLLRKKLEGSPMQDPNSMMEMMKGNITMMVPNIVMMGWVSYFFNGFVLVKVPFMLTEGFKEMLQRGVELTTLDVSYVSSLSWYFLAVFGLRGLFGLILGDNQLPDEARLMQQQMGMGANPMAFDAKKAYKAERTALDYVEHKCSLENAEANFLRKYK